MPLSLVRCPVRDRLLWRRNVEHCTAAIQRVVQVAMHPSCSAWCHIKHTFLFGFCFGFSLQSVSVLHKHLEEVQSARAERDLLQGEVSRLQQELKNATDRAQLAENIKATPKPADVTRGQEKKLVQALVLANEVSGLL